MDTHTIIVIKEYIFLTVWTFLGSTIGYFSFTYSPKKPPIVRFGRGVLSICLGMFLALPIFFFCLEVQQYSTRISMMLSGLGAFGLPDFILNHYSSILRSIAYKTLKFKVDKQTDNSNE